MRSILVLSAASRAAFEAGLASEADGLALDLAGAADVDVARENAAAWIAEASGLGRPCLALIHRLGSGLADGDLDAVVAARPFGILLPDAHGRRDAQHLGAKLAVREAEAGLPDGSCKILALAADSPAAIFELGTFTRGARRLIGIGRDELSLRRLLGVAAGASGERPEPLRVARALCLFAAAAAGAPAYDAAEPLEGEDFFRACAAASSDGFAGKLVLSAAQAKTVNDVFPQALAEKT
ncbi:aldolase [uncultured Rhodoblastus sp.]|uniref:aldolase n=1 Tax=uncultured Rhodoblastus sp. TaxID=543037 RepID=UPI0025FF5040|nr:aldolase [uncultured Rhodoblastus sp.]